MSNRKIAFRAWDKKENKMFVPDGLKNPVSDFNPDRFVHLQFTGLLSKNGVEIFEGDIVNMGDNFNSVIEWENASSQYILRELGIVDGELDCRTYSTTAYTSIGEVIGNIWENPELLTK